MRSGSGPKLFPEEPWNVRIINQRGSLINGKHDGRRHKKNMEMGYRDLREWLSHAEEMGEVRVVNR